MAQLYEMVRSLDKTNHDLVKDTLSQFFIKLSRNMDSDHTNWLQSIELILSRFPKYCLTHRNIIESYLIRFLDSEHDAFVISSAKCCHLLQQVRPTNEKAANAKSSWRQQMSLLCSTAHSVMAAAFSDAVDLFKTSGYFEKQETADYTSTPFSEALSALTSTYKKFDGNKNNDGSSLGPAQKNSILCKRLANVLTFAQAMLVEVYPVAKPVRPQMILDMIVRALSISSAANQLPMKETDKQTFACNICTVKIQALRTLDALIVCLGPNFIPYSPLVFRVATQTIRWSNDNQTKESSKVLSACYSTIKLWLTVLHCHKLEGETIRGKGSALDEEIIESVLSNVAPKLNTVTLTMSNQSMKNLSKKARRKMANTILNKSAIASHIPGEKDKEQVDLSEDSSVVISALECLEVLLITCGIFLKPVAHKRIQDVLVRACYGLEGTSDASRGLALCRALEASRVSVPSNIPSDTSHCLHVYSRLVNSHHSEIAQFCSRALLSVRVSLHGAPPTLTYAPPPLQVEEEREKTGNFVSERNRAALVSLLGEDKVPSQQKPKEIVNIPDLPSLKGKIEEDKISLSSQSSTEVQIDDSNGVDLTSVDSNFGWEAVETGSENVQTPSVSNGKMRLLDFDKKNKEDKIYDLETQLPLNISDESNPVVDADSNDSLEISYDHNGSKRKEIKYLEKIDGDNLPSTNETDDVFTCGQVVKNSQDSIKSITNKETEIPSQNINDEDAMEVDGGGIQMNGVGNDSVIEIVDDVEKTVESIEKDKILNVEDMLADFVDEKADT